MGKLDSAPPNHSADTSQDPQGGSHQTYKTVIDGSMDAAILLDLGMRPLEYNNAFIQLTGLRRRTLQRRLEEIESVFELLSTNLEPSEEQQYVRRCFEEGKVVRLHEVGLLDATGAALTVNLTLLPIGDNGAVDNVLLTLRDVSAEGRVQARFKELLTRERERADELERRVAERTRELTQALADVTRLSQTDPLTGLLNRRAFSDEVEEELARARRHGRSMAILMCDLDFFKRINDSHGHDVGDQALVAVAGRLRDTVRETDSVGRFGGEEFILLMPETNLEHVSRVGDRCLSAVRDLALADFVPGTPGHLSMSVGVSLFPVHGTDFDELLTKADQALYEAKGGGRDQLVIFNETLKDNEAAPRSTGGMRVLTAVRDSEAAAPWIDALKREHKVTVATEAVETASLLRRQSYDAFVCDVEFATQDNMHTVVTALLHLPNAVRILVVESEQHFVDSSIEERAHIDHYLLTSDAPEHINRTIEDGYIRKTTGRGEAWVSREIWPVWKSRHIGALDELIDTGQLSLVFQPIVDTSGIVRGYEALSRVDLQPFTDPEFLFGYAAQVGRSWQLGRVVRQRLAETMPLLPPDTFVSLNLHPGELHDPHLLSDQSPLYQYSRRIVLEITERGSIPDFDRFRMRIQELRSVGYRFAIDDLGAGYAGLSTVCMLEPDIIKIDKSIIRGLTKLASAASLLSRIVEFANEFTVVVVAEGLENVGEMRSAIDAGCHLLQGFHIARPSDGYDTLEEPIEGL